jgi:predicted aspartyl protease
MNTIIVPEGIKGEEPVYPLGMCLQDRNGAISPNTKPPVMKAGTNNILPPVGVCGSDQNIKITGMTLLAHTAFEGDHKYSGNLSAYNNPVIPVRLMRGSEKTEWIDAMIDTGSYYSHAKKSVLESIEAKMIDNFEANHPIEGSVKYPIYSSALQISNIPIGFSTCFMLMKDGFNYDIILGSHLFEISDLCIYGKEKRFELVFR